MIHYLRLLLLFVSVITSSISSAQTPYRTAADRLIDIQHIRLEIEVSLEEELIEGTAVIIFSPLQEIDRFELDAVGHEVKLVHLIRENETSKELKYHNTGEKLLIELPEKFPRGQQAQVQIKYRVKEPLDGLHFFKPTEDEPDVPFTVWSQGEPISNRYWFPCQDHPNERQSTELIVTVNAKYEVLSNGDLVSRTPSADQQKTIFHWKQDKSHVSYLVTLVVGEFAIVKDEWRGKPILYYVPPHQTDLVEQSFGRTPAMLDFFSDKFGIEYPWEKYAQVVVEQFTSGGMENTSATTMYEGVLHDEQSRLTRSPDWLVAHELGHQWWGDLVTCKDWSHLWLNEGFASYCEILWAEHAEGMDEAHYLMEKESRLARRGLALTRPIVDRRYDNPSQMFDSRAYPKGAWVLHMLRKIVGDEDFFKVLKRYGTVNAFQTAETSDLRKTFSELTGLSLERFFYDWTERSGHPQLKVKSSYLADSQAFKVEIKQTQEGEAFHFPLHIEVECDESNQSKTIDQFVDEKIVTLYVPIQQRPIAVRVDPDQSILMELMEEKARDWWVKQLNAETVHERMRAVSHFGESKQNKDRELLVNVLKVDPFYGVRMEAATALGKTGGDLSRDALIAHLADEEPRVREACANALGSFSDDSIASAAISETLQKDEPSYHVTAALIRSYVKTTEEVQLTLLEQALNQPSYREVIRVAALWGYGQSSDPTAVDVLLQWTKPGQPRDARRAAIAAIADYFERNDLSQAKENRIVEQLINLLKTGRPLIRRSAADALLELGLVGKPAVETLQALAERDPNLRVRTAAETALEQIRSAGPSSAQLNTLREETKSLREELKGLKERVQRLDMQ